MIEKLEKPKSIRWGDDADSCIQRHKIITDAISKINEIIDAANEQQKQIDKISFAILDLATPNGENKALESIKLDRTRKALDKDMEHITGLNNMIESWLNLINSDLDQETKLHILKSAISAYVENKGE